MNKKTIIWTVVVILLIVGGVVAVKKAKKRDASAPVAKTYPVVVSTMIPHAEQVELTLPYLALTQNDNDVNLATKIAGRVDYIKASGSHVKKGEVVARLDATTIQSNLSSVKSQLEAVTTALDNLQKSHKRTLELMEVEGASIEQSQMEENKIAEMTSKQEALKQKINELNNMLTYAVITAPVEGNISKTMVNKGNMAMPGHPVATIRSKNGFFLLIRVPTDLLISGVVLNGKTFDVISLNSTFHGLAEYKAYVDSENLMTGDRLEVDVIVYNGNGILLPFDAVLNRNGNSYVLVKEDDKAVAKEVNIIQTGEQGIVVSNNDIAGQDVVVAKQDILLKLLSGTSLKIKED